MLRYIYLALISFTLLAYSCEEVCPVLNPNTGGPGEGGPVDEQPRQVLIEEFTGVRCVNCPAGSQAIEVLKGSHGHQLVAVSIHAGFFAQPFSHSQQNLANDQGNSILSLVEAPLGYPTAVINRILFPGEERRQVGQSTWAGYIAEELIGDPSIKIDIQPDFNDSNRTLDVDIDLYIQENITAEDVRLTVYLTENNIPDVQLTPAGVQDDYVHKHVFRTTLSANSGDLLTESLMAEDVVSRSFSYTLPDTWVASECHIVGFAHLGGSELNVLQAHEVKMIE